MTDQIIIDFPELTDEQYSTIIGITKNIKVSIWKSAERKKYPLGWEGTQLCCPITLWFDIPEIEEKENERKS